jgi:hypothetical protein
VGARQAHPSEGACNRQKTDRGENTRTRGVGQTQSRGQSREAIGHWEAGGRISDSTRKPQLKEPRKNAEQGSSGGLYVPLTYLSLVYPAIG